MCCKYIEQKIDTIMLLITCDSVFKGLGGVHFSIGCLLESVNLVFGGLQQEPDPVGLVVHGEVSQPGAGVGVE